MRLELLEIGWRTDGWRLVHGGEDAVTRADIHEMLSRFIVA